MRNKYDWSGLSRDLSAWDMVLSEERKEALGRYYELLSERNRQMNLTAIEDFEGFCRLHVTDSLALLAFLPDKISREIKGARLADLGSGAGFPGMILKLFAREAKVTLIEAQAKRVSFLEEVRTALFPEDAGVRCLQLRAEEAGQDPEHREGYSVVTARAVAELSVLLEYALPLLEVGGIFAAYKSRETEEETERAAHALEVLGGRVLQVKDYVLPNSDTERRLIFVEKVKETPEKYPRRAGMAKKRPL